MEYSTLYDLIRFLQYGNHLHIGVIFLDGCGGSVFSLPPSQTIHDSAVCWKAKGPGGNNRRCYRCRQAAVKRLSMSIGILADTASTACMNTPGPL